MGLRFIHIDTINGIDFSNDSTTNSYVFIEGSRSYSPNDYNIIAKLTQPLTGVRKIYLKSFSTTILFPTVRSASRSNFINVVLNGNEVKKITLVDKIYTSIQSLIDDLNIASNATYPGLFLLFSLDSYTGNVKISTSSDITSMSVQDSNLAYILGFRNGINSDSVNYCVAAYLYNLAIDSHLYLYISNLNTNFSSNCNRINSSFKIPVNAGSYNVNYSSTNLNFEEYIEITNPSLVISELKISLIDRFGFSIHSAGSSMSVSLSFEG